MVVAGIFELLHVAHGRRCVVPGCAPDVVPLHETTCSRCGHSLPVVWRWSGPGRLLAAGCALLLTALMVWGFWSWTARRTEEHRAALLAAVSQDFHQRLQSVRAEQAEHLADELQGRHGLTDGEREQLLEEAGELIATLPRQVTPEIERSVETELREIYRDIRLDPNEATQLRAFREQQRLTEADVAQIERALLDRLKPAAEHLRWARTLVDRRMFVEAEQEYRRATEIDPSDPLAWAQLGAVLAVLHRGDEAFTSYQRALELDPLNWLAHYNLAVWYARREDTGEALSHVESALASVLPGQRAERQSVIQALLEEPDLATLRRDPRFVDLVASTPAADHGAPR